MAQPLSGGRTKVFPRTTTIQVLIAFKIYSKHFPAMWQNCGAQGYEMRLCRVTRKFSINRPTGLIFAFSHYLDLLWMPHDPTPLSKYPSSPYPFGGVLFTT